MNKFLYWGCVVGVSVNSILAVFASATPTLRHLTPQFAGNTLLFLFALWAQSLRPRH